MSPEGNYWKRALNHRLSRRAWLARASRVGMGLAGLSLVGCAAAPVATPTKAPTTPVSTPRPAVTPTPAVAKPIPGGTLTATIRSNLSEDPAYQLHGGHDQMAKYHIYNTLQNLTRKVTVEPELALSWENPDPTTFVYKLRKGVKFHDGADFNAQAVKANFDRMLDPNVKFDGASNVTKNVNAAEVVDDATVKLILKGPYADFDISVPAEFGIISPLALAKYKNDLRQNGVGTGPFQAGEWAMDSHATLKKFPGYWQQGLPYLDEIKFRVVPDSTVAVTLLKTGESDFDLDFTFKEIPLIKGDPNVVFVVEPGIKRRAVILNMVKEPFSKKAARQVIAYGVDRKAISEVVFGGLFPPADSIFPPSSFFHDTTIKNYPFDPAKAKEKMVEAGYPQGFEFNAAVSTAYPTEIQVAEIMKDQLGKIGVKVNVNVVEHATFMDAWQKETKKYDVMIISAGHSMEPTRLVERYYTQKGDYNMLKVPFPELDSLVDKVKSTYKAEERKALFNAADKLITENVWAGWIYVYESNWFAYRKRVMNYVHGPHPFYARFRETWLAK
ncbi:MAG: ABC transporter substrate-binding protein [Chloroflexi bacterium]|nr:ABC transporter substrate-binding protein [Chloroflexota bacterium]